MKQLFPLGRCVLTRGAAELIDAAGIHPDGLLARHVCLDPGTLPAEDVATNHRALKTGARIFSAYKIGDSTVWVITDAGRTVTTILLPEEY